MSTKHQDGEATMQGFKAWKAMGVGGTSYSWGGYMSAVNAQRTMAYGADDTIKPDFYSDPQNNAVGWSIATEAQRANATKSFLQTALPQRQGPHARAKPFVFPQRERNADEPQDPAVKEVCCMSPCLNVIARTSDP